MRCKQHKCELCSYNKYNCTSKKLDNRLTQCCTCCGALLFTSKEIDKNPLIIRMISKAEEVKR